LRGSARVNPDEGALTIMNRAHRRRHEWELPLVASVLEMLREAFPTFEVEWESAAAGRDHEPEVRSARSRRPAPEARPAVDPVLARCYAQLGLAPGAGFAAVRSAWRRLARELHPDRHAGKPELERYGTERLKEINLAYEELKRRLRKEGPRTAKRRHQHA
jgi:DnaJ-domain-containing protein 1